MIVPIAHAGHWIQGILYLAPVLVLVLVLLVQGRLRGADDDAASEP